jgi:UDP-N-acetylmuramoyl-L-alanyl-D-glutamate--2,6-diaminopimelate ligase
LDQALAWLRARGVRRLCTDSRRIQPGDAFVAWPGFAVDGRRFVTSALAAGAVAAVVDEHGLAALPESATWPADAVGSLPALKADTGALAAAFWDEPSHALDVVAITGTNGKTSSAWWLAQALAGLGRRCGVAGTLGLGLPPSPGATTDPLAAFRPTGLTTPDPVAWQAQLREWVDAGVSACAIEASSIGLAEHRLDGTRIAVAMFTNFTQDHLDYHGSMQAYWAAKARLFTWPELGAVVINIDDAQGAALAREVGLYWRTQSPAATVWTVSLNAPTTPASASASTGEHAALNGAGGHLHAAGLRVTPQGMAFDVVEHRSTQATEAPAAVAHLAVPFVGRYNASNLLGVVAALRALGVPLADAVAACARVGAVPGRMEPVSAPPAAPLVLVDYAHTPDALTQALTALHPLVAVRGGRLHCVVGCGGDRDPVKRPLMAAAAEAAADVLCLTSDNPRSEDPQAILAQMVVGLRQPQAVTVQPDRAAAIAQVVAQAAPADVVLVAGKGHETTQDVAGVKHPFSDVAHARAALLARGGFAA